MSDSSIMSVREMIDSAFGDNEVNVVDFKLIQAILFLLAHQLQVLGRRVAVNVGGLTNLSRSSLSVTEIRLHAHVPKKNKCKSIEPTFVASRKGHVSTVARVAVPARTTQAGRAESDSRDKEKARPDRIECYTISQAIIQSSKFGQGSQESLSGEKRKRSASSKKSVGKYSFDKPVAQRYLSDIESVESGRILDRTTSKALARKSLQDKSSASKQTSDRQSKLKSHTYQTGSLESLLEEQDPTRLWKKYAEKTLQEKDGSNKILAQEQDPTKLPKPQTKKSSVKRAGSQESLTEDQDPARLGRSDKASTEKSSSDRRSAEKSSSYKTGSQESLSVRDGTETSAFDKTSAGKPLPDKRHAEQHSSDKRSPDKLLDKQSTTKPSEQLSIEKSSLHRTGSHESLSDGDGKGTNGSYKSSAGKSWPGKPLGKEFSSDKRYEDKAFSSKRSTDKLYLDQAGSQGSVLERDPKGTRSSDKTFAEKPLSEKQSAERSTDKRSYEKSFTYREGSRSSLSDHENSGAHALRKTSETKPSEGKPLDGKSFEGKPLKGEFSEGKTSSDKRTTDESLYRESSQEYLSDRDRKEIHSSGKEPVGEDSSEKRSTEKSSSDKQSMQKPSKTKKYLTTTDKRMGNKSAANESPSDRDVMGKKHTIAGATSKKKHSSPNYYQLLEEIEEQREKVLRIIHQRADSHEEGALSPSPIESLDSTELRYEKLIVVERVPSDQAAARSARDGRGHTPRLSVVTKEQFDGLAKAVGDLKTKFSQVGLPALPENAKLMEDLRKGASLTDAMAALQLSARLEAAETALQKTLELVSELASRTPGLKELEEGLSGQDKQNKQKGIAGREVDGTPGTQLGEEGRMAKESRAGEKDRREEPETKVILKARDTTRAVSRKSAIKDTSSKGSRPGTSEAVSQLSEPISAEPFKEPLTDEEAEKPIYVTFEELEAAIQGLYKDLYKNVNSTTARSNANAANALKIATRVEGKIDEALNIGTQMNDLEVLVTDYADQINALDTGLSSQMTDYQEQLTQMQHDLETGLDNMAEALANQGGDTEAVTELNSHFTNLQIDFDRTAIVQKELNEVQESLSLDLRSLWQEIELLRDTKADRDEVADALRDKAGIGALNGLVPIHQFDAVRGDIEKSIGSAYDKFNNQEIIWQRAIDDLFRELSEKADLVQVDALRDDVNKNVDMLKGRIDAMLEIVGEPRSAAIARRIHRDANCLSCSTPAYMALEEPGLLPALPAARPPTIGAEAPAKPSEHGDHGICFPGFPVTHLLDPRSRICSRYCGGSHTKQPILFSRPQSDMVVPIRRETGSIVGSDGKTYMVDEKTLKRPCFPCNVPKEKEKSKTPWSLADLKESSSQIEPALGLMAYYNNRVPATVGTLIKFPSSSDHGLTKSPEITPFTQLPPI